VKTRLIWFGLIVAFGLAVYSIVGSLIGEGDGGSEDGSEMVAQVVLDELEGDYITIPYLEQREQERAENYVENDAEFFTFTMDEKRCQLIYHDSKEEVIADFQNGLEWLPRSNVELNSDGDVAITLSTRNYLVWLDFDEGIIKDMLEDAEYYGKGNRIILISKDYKTVTVYADGNQNTGIAMHLMGIVPACGDLQLLNGVPTEDVYVELTLANIHTGNVVWSGTAPGDTFELAAEDWDV